MKKSVKFLASTRFGKWLVKSLMSNILVHHETKLTPEYFKNKGWVLNGEYWQEEGIKERDLVSVKFYGGTYGVWHSDKMIFIANESSVEWFEMYMLLLHPDNGRNIYANI